MFADVWICGASGSWKQGMIQTWGDVSSARLVALKRDVVMREKGSGRQFVLYQAAIGGVGRCGTSGQMQRLSYRCQ